MELADFGGNILCPDFDYKHPQNSFNRTLYKHNLSETISFKIIFNRSQIDHVQRKHEIATVRFAIFNLALYLDIFRFIQSLKKGTPLKQ